MGKTNEERASINKRRIEEVIKMWEHDYCIQINDNNRTWLTLRISSLVNYLITKAEKRGRRNERKKATSEVCIFCPGLNNGECPNVNSTVISKDEQIRVLSEQIDFMEDQIDELEKQPEQQFDAGCFQALLSEHRWAAWRLGFSYLTPDIKLHEKRLKHLEFIEDSIRTALGIE